MATTPTLMYGAQTSNTLSTLYTAPASGTTIVTNVVAANPTTAAQTFTLNSANSGVSYPLLSNVTVPANTSAFFDLKQVVGTSQAITGFSNGGAGIPGAFTAATNATSNNWNSIATNGAGVWVAVGATTGAAATTTGIYSTNNGVTWATFTLPTSSIWTSVTYGNGYFVAVAGAGNAAGTSTSTATAYATVANVAATWTAGGALPSATTWVSVAFGLVNGTTPTFVAIAGAGTAGTAAAYSINNGTTWTASTLATSATWVSLTYGNGYFVAIAGSGTASTVNGYSATGIGTWTAGGALPSSTTWESVTYGNGAWVAVAGGGTAGTINAYSTTAGTWVAGSALPSSAAWYGVTYSGGNFIAVGTNVAAWTNGTGGTWTAYSTQPAIAFRAIGSGQGQVVAIAYGASTVDYSSNPTLSLSISGVVIV